MGNKSGALILLIMLIVSAFVILMVKLAAYIRHFNGETRRIIMKMQRAADEKEYCYWHKMLRCHYLCLIPFVNERNVSGAYSFFFHQPKRAEKETRIDGVFHILAPSLAAFCLCAVCLCGASWAWFTASTSTGTTAVQSSSYRLSYRVDEDPDATELAEAKTVTVPGSGRCTIKLSATGTEGATGYCRINIGDETYYTGKIFVHDTFTFTFTVKAAAGTTITLTPKWGKGSGTNIIESEGTIEYGTAQSEGQESSPASASGSGENSVPSAPALIGENNVSSVEGENSAQGGTGPAAVENQADPKEAGAREENGSPGA